MSGRSLAFEARALVTIDSNRRAVTGEPILGPAAREDARRTKARETMVHVAPAEPRALGAMAILSILGILLGVGARRRGRPARSAPGSSCRPRSLSSTRSAHAPPYSHSARRDNRDRCGGIGSSRRARHCRCPERARGAFGGTSMVCSRRRGRFCHPGSVATARHRSRPAGRARRKAARSHRVDGKSARRLGCTTAGRGLRKRDGILLHGANDVFRPETLDRTREASGAAHAYQPTSHAASHA